MCCGVVLVFVDDVLMKCVVVVVGVWDVGVL